MAFFPTSIIAYGQTGLQKGANINKSTLTTSIVSGSTTFTITSSAQYSTWPSANFVVLTGTELIYVSSRTGNVCTIGARNFGGTTIDDHDVGDNVIVVLSADSIEAAYQEIIALETQLLSGSILNTQASAASTVFTSKVTGDTQNRFERLVDGKLQWGSGSAISDTSLSRSGVGKLLVDDQLEFDNVGAGTNPLLYSNDAAQRLSLTGDLDLSASFLIGGTEVFQPDRDVAITLLPSTDVGVGIGSNTKRWGHVRTAEMQIFGASGDVNPTISLSSGTLSLGPGAGTAVDVSLTRGAANRLDLASGDSFNIVLGNLQFAGTTLFESDADLAANLLPTADNTLTLGSASRRFASTSALIHAVYGTVSDANPILKVSSAGIEFGAGGASALDVLIERTSADNLRIADNLTVTGNLTVNGTTTTVNSSNLTVDDNRIVLNVNEIGAGITAGNAGIEVERGSLTNSWLVYEETTDRWTTSYDNGSTFNRLTEQAVALTNTRVPFGDSNGRLTDDADFTFDGSKLTLAAIGSAGGLSIGGDTTLYRIAADVLATDDQLKSIGASAAANSLSATVTGDTVDRFNVLADGKIEWGSGSLTRDVNLYRSAADVLKTDDSLSVGGASGILIGADTNLYRDTADRLATDDSFQVGRFTTTNRDLLTAENGDIIYNTTTATFQGYKAGAWVSFDTAGGGITGSGTSGQVAYWNGASSITSDADLVFDGTNLGIGAGATPQSLLHVGSVTPGTGEATNKGTFVIHTSAASHGVAGGLEFKSLAASNGYGWKLTPENTADSFCFSTRAASATWTLRTFISAAGAFGITDGITAPAGISGFAQIYVDSADGDLKIIFGDGTVKTIVVDT